MESDAERGVVRERQQGQIEQHFVDAVLIAELRDERLRLRIGRIGDVRFDVAEDDPDSRQQDDVQGGQDRRVADVGMLQR